MHTSLLLHFSEKLGLLYNVFFNWGFVYGGQVLKYAILFFFTLYNVTDNKKLIANGTPCRFYRQIISEELFLELSNQIKKLNGKD